jgi:hypothetical protein
MFGGLFTWIVASAMGTQFPPDLIGFAVSAITMPVVSLLTQKIDPPRPLTDIDGVAVDLTDRVGTLGFR